MKQLFQFLALATVMLLMPATAKAISAPLRKTL